MKQADKGAELAVRKLCKEYSDYVVNFYNDHDSGSPVCIGEFADNEFKEELVEWYVVALNSGVVDKVEKVIGSLDEAKKRGVKMAKEIYKLKYDYKSYDEMIEDVIGVDLYWDIQIIKEGGEKI